MTDTRAHLDIPTDFDQIDPAWMATALDDGSGRSIGTLRWERIAEGVGLLGRLARFHMDWSCGAGPASVVVKLPSDIPEMAAQAQMFGFYDREVNFYREIGDGAAVRVPHPFHVAAGPDVIPFVIVMEDMVNARVVDQLLGCSVDEAVQVAQAAARLHAPYWGAPALHELAWLPAVNGPLYSAGQQVVIDNLGTFVDRWGDVVGPDGRALAELVAHNLNNLQNHAAEAGPLTMCHYDLRLDNLLFDDTTGDVVVIDFQLMGTHRGPFDLAYFLAWSVTPEQRAACTDPMVAAYVAELADLGVVADAQWVHDTITESMLNVVAMATLSGATAVVENERGDALVRALVERTFQAAADLGSVAFLH